MLGTNGHVKCDKDSFRKLNTPFCIVLQKVASEVINDQITQLVVKVFSGKMEENYKFLHEQNTENSLLLEENRKIVLYGKKFVNLRLLVDSVSYNFFGNNSYQEIRLDDAIGSTVETSPADHKISFKLRIHSYPLARHSYRKRRCAKDYIFNFGQNEDDCRNWANLINRQLRKLKMAKSDKSSEGFKLDIIPKKYFVVINPVSGTKKSVKVWKKIIEPMLIKASLLYDTLITKYSNHAHEIMLTLDWRLYEGIITVGGDGIIAEIVNGLSSRQDGIEALQSLAIGPIPTGTGNGLVASICHQSNESYHIINAIYIMLKGGFRNIDLSLVHTSNQSDWSFLLLGWGLIADIDILSESMRWLGNLRNHLMAVKLIAEKRLYSGRISMLLYKPSNSTPIDIMIPPIKEPLRNIEGYDDWVVIEDQFVLIWVVQTSHSGSTFYSGPNMKLQNGYFTIFIVRDISRLHLLQLLLTIDEGGHVHSPYVERYQAVAYRLEPLTMKGIYTLDGEVVPYGPIHGVLKPNSAAVFSLE